MTNRLSILIYHRVLPERDPLLPDLPDVRQFSRHLALLKRFFHVMPLSRALALLRQAALPPRAACITFDDGYADNAAVALPALQAHGLSACFFIASGYLDGGRMWNDDAIAYLRHAPSLTLAQRAQALDPVLNYLKYLPSARRQALATQLAPSSCSSLMMSSRQVLALHRAGMEIGAHTESHPILRTMSDDEARADIARGKHALEKIIDAPVTLFAYPNGKPGIDYDHRHVAMVRSLGFEAAVSTAPGVAVNGADLFQLPRYTPWERDRARFLLRLLQRHYMPCC